MTSLARTQELVWRLITAPEGVAAGARQLVHEGLIGDEDLGFLVPPARELRPADQLDVYADMYFYRLRDCLAEDFPKLAAALGADDFHDLVTGYLLEHPSRHPSLRELGRALPGFLAVHELEHARPGLVDLARLEWARVDVFDAEDAIPLTREALLAGAGADPEGFAPELVPAVRLLRLRAGTLPRWKEPEAARGTGADEPGDAALGVCVWRKGHAVLHRSLDADEEACMAGIREGRGSLVALGEALLAHHAEADAPARLAGLLARWAEDELLATPRTR